jgi:putative SOS response-associated peptidase YedK
MYERFNVVKPKKPLEDSYNVYPGQRTPVIFNDGENKVALRQFGFDVKWSKKPIFNAKVETLADKPTFSKKLRESRCLIPASRYFEWMSTPNGKKEYEHKVGKGELFAMAAVCDDDGFAIITTDAWKKLAKVHHRMPIVLQREYEDDWLNPDNTEPHKLLEYLMPLSEERIDFSPVGA